MTAHLSSNDIAEYLARACRPSDLLRVDDHLASCEECRRRLETAEPVKAGVAALRESVGVEAASLDHPSPDEITAYVDGAANEVDREIVEAHLEACRTCAEDVEDLRSVRSPVPKVVPIRSRKRSWYAVAGLAAAAALAGIFVWIGRNVPPASKIDTSQNRAPETSPSPNTTAAPPAVVTLKDGPGSVTLDTAGALAGIATLAPDDRDLIVASLRSGRVEIPSSVNVLRGRPGTLLGSSSAVPSFRPLRPVATAVESARPVFEWTARLGAISYTVSLFDTNLEKIAESEPLSVAQWTPGRALPRGRAYIWQIRARTAGGNMIAPAPPAPEARFRVLDQAEADRVATLRQRYAGSPLALGVLLAHAGLLEEAERSLKDVVAANPSSPEAQQILASVQEPSPTTTKLPQ